LPQGYRLGAWRAGSPELSRVRPRRAGYWGKAGGSVAGERFSGGQGFGAGLRRRPACAFFPWGGDSGNGRGARSGAAWGAACDLTGGRRRQRLPREARGIGPEPTGGKRTPRGSCSLPAASANCQAPFSTGTPPASPRPSPRGADARRGAIPAQAGGKSGSARVRRWGLIRGSRSCPARRRRDPDPCRRSGPPSARWKATARFRPVPGRSLPKIPSLRFRISAGVSGRPCREAEEVRRRGRRRRAEGRRGRAEGRSGRANGLPVRGLGKEDPAAVRKGGRLTGTRACGGSTEIEKGWNISCICAIGKGPRAARVHHRRRSRRGRLLRPGRPGASPEALSAGHSQSIAPFRHRRARRAPLHAWSPTGAK
jgi:hypothetical protein